MHLDLVADPQLREALAALAGVSELPRLQAAIDLVRHGAGLRATGTVSASVGQTCVVTLEPMTSEVKEAFEVEFAPAPAAAPAAAAAIAAADMADAAAVDEPAEALVDGTADLGPVLTEFLLLGIDRYPRKPGAVFAAPAEADPGPGPFAVLAKLKDQPR